MRAPQEIWFDGSRAPIHRSLWNRILTWGAPRMWSGVWVLICLMATGWSFVVFESRVYFVPMVAWGLGQAVLKTLTRWDVQWDQVLKAMPRYRSYYEAG
jgi:type IV secretory pathway TrbD component